MRRCLMLVGVCLLLGSSIATAQDRSWERGRFKLYLDATLFGYQRNAVDISRVDDGSVDTTSFETNDVLFGPFSGGGIGVGYAVTSFLIPEFYLSLQTSFRDPNSGSVSEAISYYLSPQVELVRPRGRFAPFATAGLAFVGSRVKLGEDDFGQVAAAESRLFRFGPALSVGFHSFLVAQAALDFSLRFNGTFLMRANGAEVEEPTRNRQFDLLLMVGSSFWL
jgi:hypothetical protein